MSSLYRKTFVVCTSFVLFFLVGTYHWEWVANLSIVPRSTWQLQSSQHRGGSKGSARLLSNRAEIECSSRSYTLHTSEPLKMAIGQLNRLLGCVATEITGSPTNPSRSRQAHRMNHTSVMRCFHNTSSSMSSCKLLHVYNKQNASNNGTLPRNDTTARAIFGFKQDYFEIIRLEPLVFTLRFSWQPRQRADWQLYWPFRDGKYYTARRVSRMCTLDGKEMESANISGINNHSVSMIYRQEERPLNNLPDECKHNFHVLDHPHPVPDFSQHHIYVHIIRQGTVSRQGGVRVGGTEIVPSQCLASLIHVPENAARSRHYERIFVISQMWGTAYFHASLENLPRLMPYLAFLRQNQEIMIHVHALSLARNLALLGLNPKRLVSGQVTGDVIYLPQGTQCGHFNPIAGRLLHRQYVLNIQNHLQNFTMEKHISPSQWRPQNELPDSSLNDRSIPSTPALQTTPENSPHHPEYQQDGIILIHRSRKRWLAQHEEIKSLLERIAGTKNLNFYLFSDNPLPDFKHTVAMFSRAKLVVAPHGAGLVNLIFSPTGTRVVEILCNPKVNLCFQNIHTILGQPYVGLLSVTPDKCGPLYVDLIYLQLLVLSLLDK